MFSFNFQTNRTRIPRKLGSNRYRPAHQLCSSLWTGNDPDLCDDTHFCVGSKEQFCYFMHAPSSHPCCCECSKCNNCNYKSPNFLSLISIYLHTASMHRSGFESSKIFGSGFCDEQVAESLGILVGAIGWGVGGSLSAHVCTQTGSEDKEGEREPLRWRLLGHTILPTC